MEKLRVIHQQITTKSILLDKIDRAQGNFEGYSGALKQKIYVPYSGVLDSTTKGYVDLEKTSEVLLSADPTGSIGGLESLGFVSTSTIDSDNTETPTVTNSVFATGKLTVSGTKMVSFDPDVTRVIITNDSGVTQVVSDFDSNSATSIVINAGDISGTPDSDWVIRVQANGKTSLPFTMP